MPYLFTSESVSEGHPDKVADQISDALVDHFIAFDPTSRHTWKSVSTWYRDVVRVCDKIPVVILSSEATEEIFEQHDPKRFANFQCEDCHGEDMKARNYAMPSPTMFAVPEPGTDAYARMTKAYPDMVPFMEHTVTPTIGQILGVQPFTCADCHPKPR